MAELLEGHMKRLSDYEVTRLREGPGDTEDSPLYASPTAYGYSKIGEHRPGPRAQAQARQTAETQILAGEWCCCHADGDIILILMLFSGFDRDAERTSDFTFGHTGHMDIILGRGDQGPGSSGCVKGQGLFENIKEKAKSVTKRNFL